MKERGKGMGQEVRALVDAEADLADAVGDLRAALAVGVGRYWATLQVPARRVVEAHERLTEVAAAWERVAKEDVVKGEAAESRAEWRRQAESLADMYGHPDSVRIWEFGHAPLAFRACSGSAGDEDWVALLKKPRDGSIMLVDTLPRYLRDGANSVEVVHLGDWALVIGAHA